MMPRSAVILTFNPNRPRAARKATPLMPVHPVIETIAAALTCQAFMHRHPDAIAACGIYVAQLMADCQGGKGDDHAG